MKCKLLVPSLTTQMLDECNGSKIKSVDWISSKYTLFEGVDRAVWEIIEKFNTY